MTAESGRLLAGWPGMQTIGYLNLTYNNLELAGVLALSESPHLNQLHNLQLYGNVDWRQSSQVKSLPGFAHIRNLKS